MSKSFLNKPPASYKPPKFMKRAFLSEYTKYSSCCSGNSQSMKNLIRKIKRSIKSGTKLPDYFVGIGASGIGVAATLSIVFNRPFIQIRKAQIERYSANDKRKVRLTKEGYVNKPMKFPLSLSETPFERKTYWFVDDCIDSGLTFSQAVYLCTVLNRMRCSGIALTWFGNVSPSEVRMECFLTKDAPLKIFKKRNAW